MTLEVDGDLMTVHMLHDWRSTVTLVRNGTASEAGLLPVRVPRRFGRGFEGKETTIDNCYYLALIDADGNMQVVCVYGVEDIVTMAR